MPLAKQPDTRPAVGSLVPATVGNAIAFAAIAYLLGADPLWWGAVGAAIPLAVTAAIFAVAAVFLVIAGLAYAYNFITKGRRPRGW